MRAVFAVACGCMLAVLSSCGVDQSRRAWPASSVDRDVVDRYIETHGEAGYDVYVLFHSDNIAEKMRDTSGRAPGLRAVEFYHVQIAPDPLNPMALQTAGYVRKLARDGGSVFLHEFYDTNWLRIAVLGMQGDLYRVDGNGDLHVGRFQLEAAAEELYDPPSGYGYDRLAQDRARLRLWDPEVAGQDARARGVHHRSHSAAPPVLVMNRLSYVELGALANRFSPARYNDSQLELYNRLRERRDGGEGRDDEYGGLQYRDGNPIDDKGRPLYRGALKD